MIKDKVEVAARSVGYPTRKRYEARANFVFSGVPLEGKRVLDVGCGPGTWSLWAGLHGAQFTLGIEPEADGSTTGVLAKFQGTIEELGLESRVEARSAYLADIRHSDGPFDIIVLYNVINHIDEDAVQRLPEQDAMESYVNLLNEIRSLCAPGATIVVADCGRTNFWPLIKRRSPLARTIEWDKHADPKIWRAVFERAGFVATDLRWSPLYPTGRLTGNWLVQFLTASHFVMRFHSP